MSVELINSSSWYEILQKYGIKLSDNKYVIKYVEALKEFIDWSRIKQLLEWGCGTGDFTKRIAGIISNLEIETIDCCQASLEIAQAKCSSMYKIIFKEGLAQYYGETNQYDLVLALDNFVSHFHDEIALSTLFANAARILKYSGLFICDIDEANHQDHSDARILANDKRIIILKLVENRELIHSYVSIFNRLNLRIDATAKLIQKKWSHEQIANVAGSVGLYQNKETRIQVDDNKIKIISFSLAK